MAGKKGMKGGGGARPGAGRPRKKKTVSEKIQRAIQKAVRELTKEHGETPEKAMLKLLYDGKTQDTVKASIFKSYLESNIVKETTSKLDVKATGPTIGLPPQHEDKDE